MVVVLAATFCVWVLGAVLAVALDLQQARRQEEHHTGITT